MVGKLLSNYSVKSVSSTEIQYTDNRHLFYVLPIALVILVLRYGLEKYCFAPIGLSLGIKNAKPKKAPHNPVLEKAFIATNNWKHTQIQKLAKQIDVPERQVERWLRLRKGQNKPSTLIKFCENSWRCTYYTFSFIYGLIILWDKPWLWDINECWNGFPQQPVTSDIWWYVMISLSFLWSLCISQFSDVKRKDFWQMFIHHTAAIFLACLAWVKNILRIASLVLIVHDCAEILLEGAKMAKYSGHQKICDSFFAIFTIIWIVTRLGIYPFWIIKNTLIDAPKTVPMFPAYYTSNGFLILLLLLHCFWTYLILKVAYNSFYAGQVDNDIRSSSDDYSEDSKSQ